MGKIASRGVGATLRHSDGTLCEVSLELFQVKHDVWLYGEGDKSRPRRNADGRVSDSRTFRAGQYVRLVRAVGEKRQIGKHRTNPEWRVVHKLEYKAAVFVGIPAAALRQVRRRRNMRAAAAIVPSVWGDSCSY